MAILAENKRAFFDYTILEKYEAGLVLTGQEVKSVKNGNMLIKDAFVTFHNNGAFLTNAHIPLYHHTNPTLDYNPTESRKLLLRAKEIDYLREKALQKGLTIIPLRVYTKSHLVKIEIAVGLGKHTYDKKETLKKRDIDRDAKRTLKI
jgi:SsrA-binding protein